MRIAIPTDDRETIADKTGRSKEFAIIEVVDNKAKYQYVTNTHSHESNEKHEHSHNEIIEIIRGVDLLFVKKIGKFLKKDLENNNIKYKQIEETNISDIINTIET